MSWFQDFTSNHEYDQDLGWLIENYDKLKKEYDQLMTCCKDVNAQIDAINKWINGFSDDYIKKVVSEFLATAIYVNISDAGYIIYVIPDSWDDVFFRTTGLDIDVPIQPEYGHLVVGIKDFDRAKLGGM